MSEAEDVFEHARRLIAQAKREGWADLELSPFYFEDLDILPEEIAGLTELKRLILAGTDIISLEPLRGLTGLVVLDLGGTQVSDLEPLRGLTGLVGLDVSSTGVSDLGPLQMLKRLISIDLSDTEVGRDQLIRLGGKPDLLPPIYSFDRASEHGVRLSGSAAAKEDSEIARISEIQDDRERTLALFTYLGIDASTFQPSGAGLSIPQRRPAPLEVSISDEAIAFAGSRGLPASDANTRAVMGWEALREYRENFARVFAIHNYQPLPGRLEDFDRAMGECYDPRNVVRIWSQGQRIQQLAEDAEFLASLPTGVAGDLRGFSAAISLYAERFPDVVAYRDDRTPDDVSPANVQAAEQDFQALDAIISATTEAQTDVKSEYRAEVQAGTGPKADIESSRALVASTGEFAREMAEKAQQKQNRELAHKGGEFVEDFVLKPLGLPYHLARRMEVPMRSLSRRFPNRMGWISKWYDTTFGSDDDRNGDGAL